LFVNALESEEEDYSLLSLSLPFSSLPPYAQRMAGREEKGKIVFFP
jgi:hypothetical protein